MNWNFRPRLWLSRIRELGPPFERPLTRRLIEDEARRRGQNSEFRLKPGLDEAEPTNGHGPPGGSRVDRRAAVGLRSRATGVARLETSRG